MRRAQLALLLACLAAAAAPLLPSPSVPAASGFPGWPEQFEGRPLRQLPLTPLERRFAESFPGRLGRFSDGEREIILRWVPRETRKLHPAADCFKASGYELAMAPIEFDANGARWGRFVARRGATTLSVRERVHDAAGNDWTDVSSWYWAAFWGRSSGPWWAVTIAAPQRSAR